MLLAVTMMAYGTRMKVHKLEENTVFDRQSVCGRIDGAYNIKLTTQWDDVTCQACLRDKELAQ